MTKKIIIVLAILVLAAMIPWPLPYSNHLDVTKLDAQGNQIETCEIKLHGFKTHSLIFGKRLYTLSVDGLDKLPSSKHSLTQASASITGDFQYYTYSLVNMDTGENLENAIQTGDYQFTSMQCTIHFSSDYDQWLFKVIYNEASPIYYVGAFSGDYTTDEFFDFFNISI